MSLLVCPNCNVGMVVVPRNGVEIDVCPDCQGVWLDRGELDRLMASVSAAPSPGLRPDITTADNQSGRSAAGFGNFTSRRNNDDNDHDSHNRGHGHDEEHEKDDRHGKRRGSWMNIFD
ncbi:MAG: zf-TFIIB domain-containing protein [Rhodospirillaceae bacterium]